MARDGGLSHEFAVDVLVFNQGCEGVEVVELEASDGGVVWMLEEDGLAVAAIL